MSTIKCSLFIYLIEATHAFLHASLSSQREIVLTERWREKAEREKKAYRHKSSFIRFSEALRFCKPESSSDHILRRRFSVMATPEGAVAVMSGTVSTVDSSPSKTCLKNSPLKSPILIFSFFHKAISSELDSLHRAALDFATNQQAASDIKPLFDRCHFLRTIYKHHCNAEDEVRLWLLFFFLFKTQNDACSFGFMYCNHTDE